MRSCVGAGVLAVVCLSAVTAQVPRDLVGIANYNAPSGKVEVHMLSAATQYQQSTLNAVTSWPQTLPTQNWVYRLADLDAGINWVYRLADVDGDGKPDLVCIEQYGTISGMVEVTVLSGASGYQQKLGGTIATAWPQTPNPPNWTFTMYDFDGDGHPDLIGIANYKMLLGKVELHVLSGAGANPYTQSLANVSTLWGATPTTPNWTFTLADVDSDGKPDLVGVANYGMGSHRVELHVLSGVSGYQQETVFQTPWPETPTPPNWSFRLSDVDGDGKPDLVGIANYKMPSQMVEVHVLAGASGYQQEIVSVVTPWPQTPPTPNWTFEMANMSAFVSGSAAAPTAVNPQGLTSLMVTGGDHAYYVDNNQHVCQSYFTGSGWLSQDLTAMTGTSTLAAPGSALTSVLVTGGDHVYYFDTKQHVNQLYFTGAAWINQDLTAAAQASTPNSPVPVARSGSAITSFLYNQADHIIYLDANQRVNHLWWTGRQWVNEDLLGISTNAHPSSDPNPCPASLAALNSGLNTATETNGKAHVYYTDAYQHIDHLWWTTSQWVKEDLTCVSGGATVKSGSALSGYSAADGTAHLFYFDGQPHINQAWWNTQKWFNEDLTAESGRKAIPAPASGLSSFGGPNGSAEVYYVDTQQHIHQLGWDGQSWTDLDLTAKTSIGFSVLAASQTALTSLFITGGNHVYYVGTDGQVHQIYWNGQAWVNQDITIMGSTPAMSAPTGAPTREYIYFRGQLIAVESSSQ